MLAPGDAVGILGAGQLGRMLALAAARLGFATHVFSPDEAAPAAEVASRATVAAYDDADALAAFAASVAVMTYEFENVPVTAVRPLGDLVRPGPRALEVAQDRLVEKAFLAACGLAVAPHAPVDDLAGLGAAHATLGPHTILKTRRLGYDGKGQVRVGPHADLAAAFAAIGNVPAILEAAVPFVAETSTVLARGADGSIAAYAHPRNVHEGGILRRSTVPGPLEATAEDGAVRLATAVAERLGYVGVLAIEWFLAEDGALIANEMAPRVHNTGHWTEAAALTSQFENHVRAIAGWPLGSTRRTGDATMMNLIGDEVRDWRRHLAVPEARLHLYGKREAREGRKMGHVTVVGQTIAGGSVDSSGTQC
ncbi:5-(carboxyamino)imidazole ribonucleotide synthase [Acuticoccus sp.]|uniref:5-(carboxyamino)imidazole ribonucleotide synthase n=1 Tax=Acuticoccus sp. TaxID=1904378 RepID=UPI003B5230F6